MSKPTYRTPGPWIVHTYATSSRTHRQRTLIVRDPAAPGRGGNVCAMDVAGRHHHGSHNEVSLQADAALIAAAPALLKACEAAAAWLESADYEPGIAGLLVQLQEAIDAASPPDDR